MRRMHTRPTFRISALGEAQARWRVRLSGSATGFSWNGREDMATWQRKLGSTADRETKYDLGHDAAHQLVSATLKQTSDSAVVKDERWGNDSIGNRTSEHDLSTGVTTDYSHNTTNQLVTKMTHSSGQKPWVKGIWIRRNTSISAPAP